MPKKKVIPQEKLLYDILQEPLIKEWDILGIDASLSRTGYAQISVPKKGGSEFAVWTGIGSIKPSDSSLPIWVRSYGIASTLKKLFESSSNNPSGRGLLLVLEAATINNDYLNSIHKIMNITFWSDISKVKYDSINVLLINAMTLRSQYGLKKTGNNKGENIAKANEILEHEASKYPGIDSDSCDAILLTRVGLEVTKILLGEIDLVSKNWLKVLTDYSDVVKGKGRNQRIIKKGLMHNKNYWWKHQHYDVELAIKDASIPSKKRLNKITVKV